MIWRWGGKSGNDQKNTIWTTRVDSQRRQNDVKGDVKESGDRPYRKPLKDPIDAV